MSTQSRPITNPDVPIPDPQPKKPRCRRYSKLPHELMTLNMAVERLATTKERFRSIVQSHGIRTWLLPGEHYPKYLREDVERIAREAICVGMPQKQQQSA